jgi:hypothetical protein
VSRVAASEQVREAKRIVHRHRLAGQALVDRAVRDARRRRRGRDLDDRDVPVRGVEDRDVDFRARPDARGEVRDDVHEPETRLVRERQSIERPSGLGFVVGRRRAVRAQDEVAALVAVCERADLPLDLVRVEPGALRLPQQRLVVRPVEAGLDVAGREVRPRDSEDRRHDRGSA